MKKKENMTLNMVDNFQENNEKQSSDFLKMYKIAK